MKRAIVICSLVLVSLGLLWAAAPASADNSTPNFSFEFGNGIDADDWTEGTQHIRTSDRAHMGAYSLKSELLEGETFTASSIPIHVTVGTWYVSYWAWRDSSAGTAYLQIDYYYGVDPVLQTTTATGSWQYVSYTWTVPTEADVVLQLHTDGITAGVYFDDLCLSLTALDCAQNTPTPTRTSTPTKTPTVSQTVSPSHTATPTITPTSTRTVATPTQSNTPSPTPTKTPLATYIWADGVLPLDSDILDAIEDLITLDPPDGGTGPVFSVTDANSYDEGWLISIVNLTGIEAPYTDWTLEYNAAWAGSVYCLGTDPDYSCEYFDPPPPIGEETGGEGLPFPWQPGTRARYGCGTDACPGVHSGISYIANSYGVDFLGSDVGGADIMPPEAYAVESGIVTYVCRGAVNLGVKVVGAHQFYYLHMVPDTQLQNGDSIQQGQRLGLLQHGTFDDYPCGVAHQSASTYHLHFAFQAPDGYLTMGGCILNISSGYWTCGTDTIGPLGYLSTNGDLPDPGPNPDPTPALGGGGHIWDGIVAAIVNGVRGVASALFPTALDTTFATARLSLRAQQTITESAVLLAVTQAYLGPSATELFLLLWFILTLELLFMIIRITLLAIKIIGVIGKLL